MLCLLLLPGSSVIPCALCDTDRLLLSLLRALWSFLQGVSAFSGWEEGAEEGGSPWESPAVICTLILTVWEQLHSQTQFWPQPPFNSRGTNETSFQGKEQSICLIPLYFVPVIK